MISKAESSCSNSNFGRTHSTTDSLLFEIFFFKQKTVGTGFKIGDSTGETAKNCPT
jgi:hypothetical protein